MRRRWPLQRSLSSFFLSSNSRSQVLLKANADVSAADSEGLTPLHCAAAVDVECAELLVGANANVCPHDCMRGLVLFCVVLCCFQSVYSSQVDAEDNYGRLPTHYAAMNAQIDCLSLLSAQSNIHSLDKYGNNLMHAACMSNSEESTFETISFLRKKVFYLFPTPHAHTRRIRFLNTQVFSFATCNSIGRRAIHTAITFGSEHAVKALIKLHVDVEAVVRPLVACTSLMVTVQGWRSENSAPHRCIKTVYSHSEADYRSWSELNDKIKVRGICVGYISCILTCVDSLSPQSITQ